MTNTIENYEATNTLNQVDLSHTEDFFDIDEVTETMDGDPEWLQLANSIMNEEFKNRVLEYFQGDNLSECLFSRCNCTDLNLELFFKIGELAEKDPNHNFKFSNITYIDLSLNGLTKLPAKIRNLTNLTSLDLSLNNFIELSPEIGNIFNLTRLSLSNNKLTNIPSEIGNLTNLTSLSLSDNKLTNLPSKIGNLSNLTYLFLSFNDLTELPPEIGNLSNLTSLISSNNKLANIPSEIGNLSNLTELYLSRNKLTELPAEIGKLSNLTYLYLNRNKITELPPKIGNLSSLTRLVLNNNKLTNIPLEIGNLSNLTELYLTRNKLTELPAEIGNLSNLTYLYLNRNKITELPPEIGNLSSLTYISLNKNVLIPVNIVLNPFLKSELSDYIYIHENKKFHSDMDIYKIWDKLEENDPMKLQCCETAMIHGTENYGMLKYLLENIEEVDNLNLMGKVFQRRYSEVFEILGGKQEKLEKVNEAIVENSFNFLVSEQFNIYGSQIEDFVDENNITEFEKIVKQNIREQLETYSLLGPNGDIKFFVLGNNQDELLNLIKNEKKQEFMQKFLMNYSTAMSDAVSNLYIYYDQDYFHNTEFEPGTSLHSHFYSHKTKELLHQASTLELISTLGNDRNNLNYTVQYTIKEIRGEYNSVTGQREGGRKNTEGRNNIFEYIESQKNLNDETKEFLVLQIIAGGLIRGESRGNVIDNASGSQGNALSRDQTIFYDEIVAFEGEIAGKTIGQIITDKLDIAINYNSDQISDGLIYNLDKLFDTPNLGEYIQNWFTNADNKTHLIILVYLKTNDQKGNTASIFEELTKTLSESELSSLETQLEDISAFMGTVEFDYQKEHNDILAFYGGPGSGGGLERLTAKRVSGEEKMLTIIENGGKIDGIEDWMQNNKQYSNLSWENCDILTRENIALEFLKQNLSSDIKLLDKNGNLAETINLSTVEEVNDSNLYRKSEILRFAEDDGFGKISELCLTNEELEKYISENCDNNFKNTEWPILPILQREKVFMKVFKNKGFIILENDFGVRKTIVNYNFDGILGNPVVKELCSNGDVLVFRGHNVMVDEMIINLKTKNLINPNSYILNGGCSRGQRNYDLTNNFFRYNSTGKGLASLYLEDIFIDILNNDGQITRNGETKNITKWSDLGNLYLNNHEWNQQYTSNSHARKGKYISDTMNIPGFDMNKINNYIDKVEEMKKIDFDKLVSTKNIDYLDGQSIETVDSNLTAEKAIGRHFLHQNAPQEIIEQQRLMEVAYYGFDGKVHQGQIVVSTQMEESVYNFFKRAFELEFPIQQAIPVCEYEGVDANSMAANNSSGFNYRVISGTHNLSKHSYGVAIDINPIQNPDFNHTQKHLSRVVDADGTLHKDNDKGKILVDYALNELDWKRGGNRNAGWEDPQHFQMNNF